MENLNESRNIIGMADILVEDDQDLDIDALEKSITQRISLDSNKKIEQVDIAQEYDVEIEQLIKRFDIDNTKSTMENTKFDSYDQEIPSHSSPTINNPSQAVDDHNPSTPPPSFETPVQQSATDHTKYQPNWDMLSPRNRYPSHRITDEERKQYHINKVISNIDKEYNDDNDNFISQEEEEDEIVRILEQIDLLRTNLKADGVDIDRVPEVDQNSSKKEIKAVLKILQIKNDRLRYCDMFEEGVLACSYGLESIFDGKKDWFGTKIDLTGWSESVKVKLRRMRYDTSSFVSDVMKGYQIGHGWKIILELLPSLFLYSRDRRLRSNDNLISDASYKDAIHNLQNT